MIKVASIDRESIVDGEGLRYVIFAQGCNHNCKGCHNPSTHPFNGGTEMSVDELINDIKKDPLLDGVTFSGGDPFFQAKEFTTLAKHCHDNGLSVWAYTGFTMEQFLKYKNGEKSDERINLDMIELLNNIDILVDGPFILEKRSLTILYRGSTNQRLIDVKKSIKNNKIITINQF